MKQYLASLVKISEEVEIAYRDRTQLTPLDTFLFTDIIEQETLTRISGPVAASHRRARSPRASSTSAT